VIWSGCPSNLRHQGTVAQAALATALNDLRAFEANLHVGPSPVDLLVSTQAPDFRAVMQADWESGGGQIELRYPRFLAGRSFDAVREVDERPSPLASSAAALTELAAASPAANHNTAR